MIIEQDGDITECDTQYIVHQCNCVSDGNAVGVAATIFKKFPWSDCYNGRKEFSEPGTIDIRGKGKDERLVIETGQENHDEGAKRPNEGLAPWMN
jgi:O-acetyl-ADP-ribose deacetylase (regulator of RNase III)